MCVSRRRWLIVICGPALLWSGSFRSDAAELSSEHVRRSIDNAKRFLTRNQKNDGSWPVSNMRYPTGLTSLALLSLINAGMTVEDEPIRKGLRYLRAVPASKPTMTYEVSLMIMALAAAKDGERDIHRIQSLAIRLEAAQHKNGESVGGWGYETNGRGFGSSDRSNTQFAVLGLRDAAHAGIPVDRKTWERAQQHWIMSQNRDGSWGYSAQSQTSRGSMTVAGIASLVITSSMLREENDFRDGKPNCCPKDISNEAQIVLERGLTWLGRNITVARNPGSTPAWHLYYMYGLERAGRLSGRRFIGKGRRGNPFDWYREGAMFLTDDRQAADGSWQGTGPENVRIVCTSYALLFLSKGLAPVLINKLKYGPVHPATGEILGDNWNKHHNDIRNLTDRISGMKKWPKLLTWQVVDLPKISKVNDASALRQAPILYLSGLDAPEIPDDQIPFLKEYIAQGGFIFAVNNCNGAGFDQGFRALIPKITPGGDLQLKRLEPDHPVYKSEYLLDPSIELWGVDFGCRTAIIYSPDDLSCLWDKWSVSERPAWQREMIKKNMRIGVNVVAYATGREILDKFKQAELHATGGAEDRIERGLLQIAQLRHQGGWDTAPSALRNLLMALNRAVGKSASTKKKTVPASDPDLFKYPILYMHGRNRFRFGRQERERLKEYLKRGGVLFTDSCCGSKQFDQSFRDLMAELFLDQKLERIPKDHEMFTTKIGHDIRKVHRRVPDTNNRKATFNSVTQIGEPVLEGIKIDNRYAVIYSKYDISCALERQASVACAGYVEEDAYRIAVNIILYAMLQDVHYAEFVK
jgi:hypothetical protein